MEVLLTNLDSPIYRDSIFLDKRRLYRCWASFNFDWSRLFLAADS